MGEEYTRPWRIFGASCVDIAVPSIFDGTAVIVCKSLTRQICIQRIVFDPAVFVATVMTFQDSTGLIISTFEIPAMASSAPGFIGYTKDFGPRGIKLTKGANLVVLLSNPGLTGNLHIDAYQGGLTAGVPQYVAPSTAGTT